MPAAQARSRPPLSGWQQRSSQFFCLLIVFGFPIFSVPCPKGACTSPLDVVATYAHVKRFLPEYVIKGMLYPTLAMQNLEVIMSGDPQTFSPPEWDSVLTRWNLTADMVEKDDAMTNFEFSFVPNLRTMFEKDGKNLNWEFIGACTVCLLGGFFSIFGPNTYSMWGILLVLWYIFFDGGRRSDVHALPMFMLGFLCSLGWVDFRGFFQAPPEPTPSAEAKYDVESKKKE
ncbi:hypothetical protein R1sor_007180 [Riccia sorocarpa]|uniref:Chlororespiratory reduction 6 n=1 Tax=Riccia sorocarpa TaxID=122646 RepID=A0ABD3HW02_9MARC